ncbi:EAL domain-containing protein [Pulveribacter sp.]|uniref:sensor domain-containing protein n=1 Tax=Pulveribacter sp. TaxID=2678893 RepID=UPI0028ACE58B|nr:EAL domain-containing protein [Pulveribacter sp.]
MSSALLLSGMVHLLVLGIAAALPQGWLAQPRRRLRLALGLACGAASLLLALHAVHSGLPGPLFIHPTLVASAAFLWGPVAGAAAAVAALPGLGFGGMPGLGVALAGAAAAAASAALGGLWWWLLRRRLVNGWVAVAGLAATLPLALSAWAFPGLPRPLPGQDWLAGLLPWGYVIDVALLSGGVRLLYVRARTLRALAQREEELVAALRATGGGRWEWDVREQRLSYGGTLYRRFGLPDSPDEGAGRLAQMLARSRHCRRWSRDHHHPEDLRRLAPYLRRVLTGQEASVQAEYRIRDEQGRWRWVITRGRAVQLDASGRVLRLAGMDLDITEQREQREALKASETKYTTIYQTLPDAAGITHLDSGRYVDVNPAFERLIRLPRGSILGRTSLELGVWGGEEERQRLLHALATYGEVRGLPMTVQRGGEPVEGLMSARSAQVDGQKCLVFVFHDLTQERHVRQELLAANRLLREAGWMARLGVWEEVPGKGLSYWSDVCFHIHGLEPGSALPRQYLDTFVLPEWREQVREELRRCLHERRTWQAEMQIQRADGRHLWVRARGEPVVEGGQVVRIRGILQDIDEVRRAAERLRASEERLTRVFHLLPSPLGFSRRRDGVYLDVNPAWEQAVGYTREQSLGKSSIELGICTPQMRRTMVAAAGDSGELVGHEMEITIASGERRTILQSLSPIELNGEDCWLFVLHDITERKQTEQRVREREELLSLTIAAATLGLWDCDLTEGTISGDARWRELLGLPPQEPPGPVAWNLALTQADMVEVVRELSRHKANPAVPFDVTLQGIATAQGRRWVRSLGKIVAWNERGEPLRMVGMTIDVSSQRTQEQQLERMAHYDALTGLPNRVLLERRLQEGMRQSHADGTHLGVGYLDLDGFKPVNDRLGHAAGDRLLVMVAQRLQHALRPGDCVARLGGDEFVVLLPALTGGAECESRLQAVMDSVSAPYPLDGERVAVTASIGYTLYPDDGADADALLRHADQAMYAAKQAGRNRYHAFDAAHEREHQARQGACARLAQAIAAGELVLHLQPKVDMCRGTVVGAEALVRWNHPDEGLLPPIRFLPLLDGHDALQQAFGQWVVDEALALIGQLAHAGQPLPVSVNITPEHLHSEGFADWMLERLARHPRLPAHLLQLELTESAALYDIDHAARELARLRAQGVGIAFDDFGTGYSSLAYLRRLPVDHLKLDRSFVTGMLNDAGDRAIVQGVIGLSRSFGCEVIAEGVETVEQGRMLLAMGCALAQGYCIARPMPQDEFTAWARQWQAPAQWLDAATGP